MDTEHEMLNCYSTVQLADFRNFAHGRHHWLAKRSKDAAIFVFATNQDSKIAKQTVSLIPEGIPLCYVDVPQDNAIGCIYSIIIAILLTGFAGKHKGIDPGRPGVPLFGRKIYHLNAFTNCPRRKVDSKVLREVAIERKSGFSIEKLRECGQFVPWQKAYNGFVKKLKKTHFKGIVLDYDGTLCDSKNRFEGWPKEVSAEVVRILRKGTLIGIATGIGISICKVLRKAIPKELWGRVLIGYLNGANIAFLSDSNVTVDGESSPELKRISQRINNHVIIGPLVEQKQYPKQISVRFKTNYIPNLAWDFINELVHGVGVRVVCSSHSIDIIEADVSKHKVMEEMQTILKDKSANILCLGDKGQWYGNDFQLLSEEFSLSVDETSSSHVSCWNLAPPGKRGEQAIMYYLKHLSVLSSTGEARLKSSFWGN